MTAGPPPASLSEAGIAVFTYPGRAAAALGQIAQWAEWRARPAGHVVTPPGIDPRWGRAAVRKVLADAGIAEHAAEFLVQEQIRDGVEMIVGVSHDPAFGPLVLAGLGGTTAEVLGDVAVRITPLSNTDVDEMLHSPRSYRLLTGYRQSPPLDVAAFAELLHRVSAMVEDIPEITELDLNPVFVRQHGAVAADVRIRLSG
jgi:acetate---CoA ligase (ADP-forming)